MTVIINHNDDVVMGDKYFTDKEGLNFTWEGNGKYKYIMENFKPDLNSRIIIQSKAFDMYGEYDNEFGEYFTGWIWKDNLLYQNPSDIKLFTKNQIRLFIRFFYAFHGYEFKDDFYHDYFNRNKRFHGMNGTEYELIEYTINPNFSINDFNEIEWKNIDYLRNLEKMIPSSEQDKEQEVLPWGMFVQQTPQADILKVENSKISTTNIILIGCICVGSIIFIMVLAKRKKRKSS